MCCTEQARLDIKRERERDNTTREKEEAEEETNNEEEEEENFYLNAYCNKRTDWFVQYLI